MSGATRKSVVARLSSPRLAAWLIALLMAYSMLSFVFPQRSQLTTSQYAEFRASNSLIASAGELLGLDSVFASYPMLVLVGLLALNIAVCTVRRVLRHRRLPSPTAGFRAQATRPHRADEDQALTVDRARRELEAGGWRVLRDDGALLAMKGGSGFWGSVLLHLAMLAVVAGASWTALTGFAGTIVIAEGQTVVDQESAYTALTRLPRIGNPYTASELTLEAMKFTWEDDILVSVIGQIRAVPSGGSTTRQSVRVNYPLLVDGKQYLLRDSGLAADVTIDDGTSTQRLVVNLAEETPLGWQDEFPLADGRTLRLRLAPVPLSDGEVMPAQNLPPADPELRMQVVDDQGVSSVTGIAYLGQTAESDGVFVTLHDAPVWSTFLARGDRGRWITYTGLWACVAGITWRFLVPERRIALAARERNGTDEFAVGYRVRPWIGFSVAGDEDLMHRLLGSAQNVEEST